MFEAMKARLAELATLPERVAAKAAPRIEARLRADATSRIGRVPAGISATSDGENIVVEAPDWVMDKARKYDEPAAWLDIVAETAREEIGGE